MAPFSMSVGQHFQTVTNEMLDFVLYMKNNRDKAHELLKNPEKLPIGHMEVLWNDATGYSYVDEFKNKDAAKK